MSIENKGFRGFRNAMAGLTEKEGVCERMASDREIASKLPTLESSIYLIEKALFLSVHLRTNVHSTLLASRTARRTNPRMFYRMHAPSLVTKSGSRPACGYQRRPLPP